jgi:hypothetical protein
MRGRRAIYKLQIGGNAIRMRHVARRGADRGARARVVERAHGLGHSTGAASAAAARASHVARHIPCSGISTPERERGGAVDGSFSRKRSPDAGDGCTADQCQPGLLLAAELGQIADAGARDPGICNGPILLQKSKIIGR